MNTSKKDKAYVHFNNIDHYLRQRFDIRVRAEIVRELTGEIEGLDIIDFGCGDGSISLQFQSDDNLITLVDLSENMLQRARSNILPGNCKRVELFHTKVNEFSTEKKYDLIICIGLLAHVDSVYQTLESISNFLKPDGCCLIQITDESIFFTKCLNIYNNILDKVTGQFGYTRNQFSYSEIISTARKFGLIQKDSRQYSIVLPGFTTLLPDNLMYRYHNYIRKSSFLSSLGTDFIIKFKKN